MCVSVVLGECATERADRRERERDRKIERGGSIPNPLDDVTLVVRQPMEPTRNVVAPLHSYAHLRRCRYISHQLSCHGANTPKSGAFLTSSGQHRHYKKHPEMDLGPGPARLATRGGTVFNRFI